MGQVAGSPGLLVRTLEARLPKWAGEALERSRGQDVVLFASGLAFYAIVSVVPLTILTIWIASVVMGDDGIRKLAEAVKTVAPEGLGADKAITTVAQTGASAGLPAAIGGLWPATAYGSGVTRAFLRLSPSRKQESKGLRGRGLLLIVLLPLFVLGGLVGSFVGGTVLGDGGVQKVVGLALALVTGFVGVSAAIVLLYKIFPPEPMSWRAAVRGTAVAAGGISGLSLLYTIYIAQASGLTDHYASTGIAGLVLLALWLFLSNVMLLFGFQVALGAQQR